MPDLDKGLVVAIVKGGRPAYRLVQEKIQLAWLANAEEAKGKYKPAIPSEGKRAYEYLCDYFKTYNDLPPLGAITQKTGISLPADEQQPVEYFIDSIRDRQLQTVLNEAHTKAGSLLSTFQPKEALEGLEAVVRQLRSQQVVGSKVVSLGSLNKEVLDWYERVEAGKTGVLTPWPIINEATLGLWPQELAIFVARVGIGKTWSAALIADDAWRNQKLKVLFATTEMKPRRIAGRLHAIRLKLPYKEFTHGKLGEFGKKKLKGGLDDIALDDRFHIVGGDFDFQIGSFEAAIDQVGPDIVILDGAYLLRVDGISRSERAANAFDELKRLTNRCNVPIVVTMQFNREVKANQANTVRTESIALTDVASWNADLIYGLIQTPEMKAAKKLVFKALKVREGQGDDLECNWDLGSMNFSEIGILKPEGGGGGDADEYGTSSASVAPPPTSAGGVSGGDVPF